MINISKILRSYTPLGAYIFGIAILGYLGYHTVQWIIDKCAKTKQIDGVAQRTIISTSPQGLSPKNNHTTSKVLPFPKIIITSQDEETQVSKITLKQQSGDQKIPDVTKTQSVFRGHIVRLSLKQMQVEEKLEEKKSAAATKIQSVWKGYLARIKLKKHVVSYDLLLKAKPYVDYPSNRQDVPLASNGNTKVYLPKVLPIVLKQSGSPANRKRFHQMRQARDICEKNNYEHLVIPKARVYGEFIIESRLPISVDGTKEQIGFYIENRARFTDAVKEFTGFLCQSTFSDITGQTNDPYQVLFKTPIGRYDNVALYLKEDQGKIGLIDLEQFTPKFSKLRKDWCFQRCRNAVDLFPYHLDEIMNVAKRFDPHIEFYSRYLELERTAVLEGFKLAYEDHLEFIRQKGITAENPSEIAAITPARRERIKEAMIALIPKDHDWVKNCLGKNPEKVIKLFKKYFPKILDSVTAFLSEMLKQGSIDNAKESIFSHQQLLSYRTLYFTKDDEWYKDLQKKVGSELRRMKIEKKWITKSFISLIIQSVFKELAKGREIAYYNPCFGTFDDSPIHCIFC